MLIPMKILEDEQRQILKKDLLLKIMSICKEIFFSTNYMSGNCKNINSAGKKKITWLHTKTWKYNLSAFRTCFECERAKCTYLGFT